MQLDDFLKVIPQRSGFMKSLGLTGTRLVSVTASALDERYTLAKVVWGMSRGVAEETRTFEARATYVLLNTAVALGVVFLAASVAGVILVQRSFHKSLE